MAVGRSRLIPGSAGWVGAVRLPKRSSPGPCSLARTNNQTVLAEAGIYCCKHLGLFCRPWSSAEAKVKFYAPCHARARRSRAEMCNSEPRTTQDVEETCTRPSRHHIVWL